MVWVFDMVMVMKVFRLDCVLIWVSVVLVVLMGEICFVVMVCDSVMVERLVILVIGWDFVRVCCDCY